MDKDIQNGVKVYPVISHCRCPVCLISLVPTEEGWEHPAHVNSLFGATMPNCHYAGKRFVTDARMELAVEGT